LKLIHFVLVFLLIFLAAAFCAAQNPSGPETSGASQSPQPPATAPGQTPQQAPPPAKPSAGQPAQPADQTQSQSQGQNSQNSKDAAKDESGTSKDRLFFALPNFLTLENAGQVPPLTTGQKYKVVALGSFDPMQIVWYSALSGICQAENCEPGYGQGWVAYAKRFGTYAADGTIENFFVGAILPSMLHQDPRYFQLGHGTFVHRTGYAMSRIFVTRTDSGKSQFNYSEIVGAALASAISTYSYHPHPGYHPEPGVKVPYVASDRTLKNTASVWGSQVGYDMLTLVVKEFWPDVRRKLKKHYTHGGDEPSRSVPAAGN
jgi:hypothetical protein